MAKQVLPRTLENAVLVVHARRPAIVLLVDDDVIDQRDAERAFQLAKIPNRFLVVNNGEEAIDYLYRRNKFADPEQSPRPDLILLDLNMPRMTGLEVLEIVKKDPKLQSIVTVALTSSSQEADVDGVYQRGGNSFITKPSSRLELEQAMIALGHYWFEVSELPAPF